MNEEEEDPQKVARKCLGVCNNFEMGWDSFRALNMKKQPTNEAQLTGYLLWSVLSASGSRS